MHELSITQAIIDTAIQYAQQAHAKTIHVLFVRVGALSGIVPDSLQFYFELARQGTPAEGARLEVELVPPRARCRACGAERDLVWEGGATPDWSAHWQNLGPCACGQQLYELTSGLGCYLDSLEVD